MQLYKNGGVGALNDMGTQARMPLMISYYLRRISPPSPADLASTTWACRRRRCTRSDAHASAVTPVPARAPAFQNCDIGFSNLVTFVTADRHRGWSVARNSYLGDFELIQYY